MLRIKFKNDADVLARVMISKSKMKKNDFYCRNFMDRIKTEGYETYLV